MGSQSYTAHESFWTDVKMWISMIRISFLVGMVVQIIVVVFLISSMDKIVILPSTGEKLIPKIFLKYHANFFNTFNKVEWQIDSQLIPYAKGWPKLKGEIYNEMVDHATNGAYMAQHNQIKDILKLSLLSYLCSILYIIYFIHLSKQRNCDRFIRGAKMIPIEVLNEELAIHAQENPLSLIKIGDTTIPFDMEAKHMLILGTSGSGKGVLMNQLVDQINERKKSKTGECCIFYDLKGEFVAKQFQEGDYIFSPFDARSIGWNIFNEIESLPDFDIMSKSLFISPDEKNAYWYNCAGDVFKAGLIYLKMSETTTNVDLWNFFSLPLAVMKSKLMQLPLEYQGAMKHIDKEDAPASASIVSILQERIQFFQYLTDLDGDFSFRKYIREQDKEKIHPNLYILNIKQYSAIFKPLMTLCIDAMIRETLSLPDDLNKRIWFIIDELGSLYRMDSILDLETAGRSKGGCLVCANQDLGRIEEMYGRANLKSFFNNFNTNFTFRIKEPETAEFLSKAIGDQQLVKTNQSRQMSPSETGDRRSESDQEKTERLLMPVEFQMLQDLEAVINIAGFGVSKINIPPIFYKEKRLNFEAREFKSLGQLISQEPVELAAREYVEDEDFDDRQKEETQRFNL